MMGSYPPYGVHPQQQQQQMQQQQQQQQQQHQQIAYQQRPFDPSAAGMMGRPRLETGFPLAVMPVGANGGGMQGQVGSPNMGGSPGGGDGMGGQPLTPVEEALRGFLSPDLGDLGH
jgi:hypothetical protein